MLCGISRIGVDLYLKKLYLCSDLAEHEGRGMKAPLFLLSSRAMKFEEKIKKAIEESVAENPDLFILNLDIKPDHTVLVTVDGYKPVPLSECIRISRDVESQVDKDEHDYALTVSTFDISQWFSDRRQFHKNIGKKIKVKTPEGEKEGMLVEITGEGIVLENKVREPKPVGKGKHTVIKKTEIPFEQIEKAKVVIQF